MALPILDGNQSATTLSSILTSGEHIPAHTVVSLGTQAITDMRGAVSGSVVSISNFPATQTIAGTVTANLSESITEPIDSTTATQAIAVHIKDADGNNWGAENIFPVVASGTVTANTFALQGTAVTTSNFTSTTASTLLAGYNATREVLTIFNEGAGNLHVCAGATCTTIAYQVRLSAGDYYEVPNHQTTITHSAVFATAGTARVTQVS